MLPNAPSLEQRLAERNLPVSKKPVMFQLWRNLLFLHWEIPPEILSRYLPPGIFVDTYEEKAYLGIVPFVMRGVRPRFLPTFAPVSNFLELNLRTYVYDKQGRPGIWFFSLDANQAFAVAIARSLFHLPYHYADMETRQLSNGSIGFSSRLRNNKFSTDSFEFKNSKVQITASPQSLEFFLVERYRLFSYNPAKKKLYSGKVHHAPYKLNHAKLNHFSTSLFERCGLAVDRSDPVHVAMSEGVDVKVFPLSEV